MSAGTEVASAGRRPATPLRRVFAYGRLAKLMFYYHWYPIVVAWLLLPDAVASSGRTYVVLALALLSAVSLASCGCALDDVQGLRDHIDDRTYDPEQGLRNISMKPLLLGEITERAAVRFAYACGAVGLAAGVATVAVAPHRSPWLLALFLVTAFAGVQYAYGLKFSYFGGGELLVAYTTGITLVIPYVLLTGKLTAEVALLAVMLGCWFIQISIFSNTADAEVDRSADRLTWAARLDNHGNKLFIAGVFAVGWTATAAGFAGGYFPGWLALGLVPCWFVQVRQLREGLGREDWFKARSLGRRAFDLGLLGVTVVYLVLNRL